MNLNQCAINGTLTSLCGDLQKEYSIDSHYFEGDMVKRGLRNADGTGVMAGVSKIGSVQGYYIRDGERVAIPGELYYRGINVMDIAESHQRENSFGYEEVAYLLLFGKLPAKSEYDCFREILCRTHKLPDRFFEDMILKAPSKDIMNKLERSVLALYSYDDNPDDTSLENVMRQSIELVGRFPSIVANAYAVKRHVFEGHSLYIHHPKENLSVAENFLRMIRRDKVYTDEEAKLLDLMFILHAEHGGGNNSAFACRTVSSSGTDTYSAIAAAIGSLKGPLHGGANAKVTQMMDFIKAEVQDPTDDAQLRSYLAKLLAGQAGDRSGKIYGLGHAVYTITDPRAVAIKKYARSMAQAKGRLQDLELIESVERLGIPLVFERSGRSISLCANVDLYSGLVYDMLDIPKDLYTPLFAIARITGWCAHRIEELVNGKRIIRPAYRSAHEMASYTPMEYRTEPTAPIQDTVEIGLD